MKIAQGEKNNILLGKAPSRLGFGLVTNYIWPYNQLPPAYAEILRQTVGVVVGSAGRRCKTMLKEFRDFVARGNVIELAVGVILGVAFGKVVASAVNDLIMPPIGMAIGGVDFTNLFVSLNGQYYPSIAAAEAAGAPTINYGRFLNTSFEFLIVAFAVFLMVKQINRLKGPAPAPAETRDCPFCVSRIPVRATRCPFCTADLTTFVPAEM
jgi:large conductance mechanosensitive channel